MSDRTTDEEFRAAMLAADAIVEVEVENRPFPHGDRRWLRLDAAGHLQMAEKLRAWANGDEEGPGTNDAMDRFARREADWFETHWTGTPDEGCVAYEMGDWMIEICSVLGIKEVAVEPRPI